ncbi:MAG: FtsW/RodA/SpoVE family cell cycle protein [Rickettsia sp.]|nr:FtsW/RodA/SpoVE family cell cycle protein [Rickettsia sp.]
MRQISKILSENLNNWYKSTDIPILISIFCLYFFSLILIKTSLSNTPLNSLSSNILLIKQSLFIILSIIILISFSNLHPESVVKISYIGLTINIILLLLAYLYGQESKGAKRWIHIMNISYQPSELIKPFFFIIIAKIMCFNQFTEKIKILYSLGLFLIISIFLILQPDFSMLVIIAGSFFVQILFSNIHYRYPLYFLLIIFSIVIICFLTLPHLHNRIMNFLSSDPNKNYQISKSLAAFKKGGIYGLGPGEGTIKKYLPDAHTDFILSVAAEEFGLLAIFAIITIFIFIIIRLLLFLAEEKQLNEFNIIAIIGIIANIALQVIINISVTINLIPTTGITLPFISYGGSSHLAMAISIAMILSLKKKKISLTRYQAIKRPF